MKVTKTCQHTAYTWRNSVSSPPGETSPKNPFLGGGGNHSKCVSVCDFSTWLKQWHYDSHHICVKGLWQPCSSGLWQIYPGWPQCSMVSGVPTTQHAVGTKRRHSFNGQPQKEGPWCQKCNEPQEEATHRISPSHSRACLPLFPEMGRGVHQGVENATGGGWCVFLFQTHSPLQHLVFFMNKN